MEKFSQFYFGVNLYYCFMCVLRNISFFRFFFLSFFLSFFLTFFFSLTFCYLSRMCMCLNIFKCQTYISVVKETFIEDIAVRRRRFLASRSQDSLHKDSERSGSFNFVTNWIDRFQKLIFSGRLMVIQHIDCSSIVNMHKKLDLLQLLCFNYWKRKSKKFEQFFNVCFNNESWKRISNFDEF